MAVFKCKMCGGTLEINNNETVATCEYCGTKQTLPKLDDEKKFNLYDRANHFRRNNEFDKAMGIYEQILNEDKTDAEAYWSLVLCQYGIEYVEDPASHKRVPTVNRAQFTSVLADENYKAAIQYADEYQKEVYEQEAKAIDEIQKGILAISQREEPFDVFICYKETDNNGRRTPDSVLANDLYHQLTQEGFKVFFSRITLEDKLGTAYEPYIFAALNSSKVMVVLGTKPEYFNAVWVKNEWSRYLALIKNGADKMLIPAYKDMDPYDLPEEFSHLQAQDMSKLGFMQDLIRGIKKIVQIDEPKSPVKETVVVESNANITPLLKRGHIFLEDEDWASADEYFEKVLDMDPECAEAYLGKLLAELRVSKKEELLDCSEPFNDRNNFEKVKRFGDKALADELDDYIVKINERNELNRLENAYNTAVHSMKNANSEEAFRKAATKFDAIKDYKDSRNLAVQCREQADICYKNFKYDYAMEQMKKDRISSYEEAISKLERIRGWKDADEKISECQRRIEEIKAQEEADRIEAERKAEEERLEKEHQAELARIEQEKQSKRNKKIAIIIILTGIAVIVAIIINNAATYNSKYNEAMKLMGEGKQAEAMDIFYEIDGYKDSREQIVKYEKSIIANSNIGDTVIYGEYEQDNDTFNGKEKIEWKVLTIEDNKALLISVKGLDIMEYNSKERDAAWENSTLRAWLNDTFFSDAFRAEEQKNIIPTKIANPYNSTTDKIFLLSIEEVEKYFETVTERTCQPTPYVNARGATSLCCWWLRSPGEDAGRASLVEYYGGVDYTGVNVYTVDNIVRPAMWINLK